MLDPLQRASYSFVYFSTVYGALPHRYLLQKPEITLPLLFGEYATRYSSRPGGYTRIHKYGHRPGDNAPSAIVELVDGPRDIRFEMTARAVGRETVEAALKGQNGGFDPSAISPSGSGSSLTSSGEGKGSAEVPAEGTHQVEFDKGIEVSVCGGQGALPTVGCRMGCM